MTVTEDRAVLVGYTTSLSSEKRPHVLYPGYRCLNDLVLEDRSGRYLFLPNLTRHLKRVRALLSLSDEKVRWVTEGDRQLLDTAIAARNVVALISRRVYKQMAPTLFIKSIDRVAEPVELAKPLRRCLADILLTRAILAEVNFRRPGWVKRFTEETGVISQHVKKWFLKWHPEFYSEVCRQRAFARR